MIKYIQKLKAKKGFTLVELIVVIAIIGVLAAILIPTMLGYVTSSRVTSSDSTASSLRETVNAFIVQLDSENVSIKRDSTNAYPITIQAGTLSTTDSDAGNIHVTVDTNLQTKSIETYTMAKYEKRLANQIENDYDFEKVYAKVWIKNGKSIACVFYNGGNDGLPTNAPGINDASAWDSDTYDKWDGTAGITSESGAIVGTSPKLKLAES